MAQIFFLIYLQACHIPHWWVFPLLLIVWVSFILYILSVSTKKNSNCHSIWNINLICVYLLIENIFFQKSCFPSLKFLLQYWPIITFFSSAWPWLPSEFIFLTECMHPCWYSNSSVFTEFTNSHTSSVATLDKENNGYTSYVNRALWAADFLFEDLKDF